MGEASYNYNEMTIGEILKKARQDLKLDPDFVGANLKVKTKDVIALEEDNASLITSHLYLTGFIKSYGKLVKIDERIIEQKIKSLSIDSNINNKKHKLLIEEDDDCSPDRELFYNAVMCFVVICLLLFSVGQFKSKNSVNTDAIFKEMNNL